MRSKGILGFCRVCAEQGLLRRSQEVPAPPDGGYLIIGDDTVISHCQLAAFNTSKVWFQRAIARKQENLAAWLDVVEVGFPVL